MTADSKDSIEVILRKRYFRNWRCILCLKRWKAVLIDILIRATILTDDRDKDDERRKTPAGGSI